MAIRCGNCKQYHQDVDQVRNCYGVKVRHTARTAAVYSGQADEAAMDAMVRQAEQAQDEAVAAAKYSQPVGKAPTTATEKQVAFLSTLLAERQHGYPEPAKVLAGVRTDRKAASALITTLLAMPKVPKPTEEPQDGYSPTKGDVHWLNGNYYRVHFGQRSGKPYVVQAVVQSEALWAEDGTLLKPGVVEWPKATGMLRNLSNATLATAEQATAFGKLAGRCCFCSTPIDTPESTAVGYGPVCAAKRGLPWGDTATVVG